MADPAEIADVRAAARARDPGGDRPGRRRPVRRARLPRDLDAGARRRRRGAAGGDLPLVPEQGGDPRPPPGRLHGAAHRPRRRRDGGAGPGRRSSSPPRSASTSSTTGCTRARRSSPTARSARSRAEPRRALIAKRDDYQAMFGGLIGDGIREGSLRTSDVRVATYAILLQCTGVALWFDPAGPLTPRRGRGPPRRARARLARRRRGTDRRRDRGGRAARPVRSGGLMAIKPPALPEKATIAVVAPASPPQTRSEIEQATAVLRVARSRGRLRPERPQGPRLPRGHRRGARRRPAVGAERARDRHGPRARGRLRHRAPAPADRLGRARRPAHRLRLQRPHRPAPVHRRPRRLGQLLRPELPALHPDQGRLPADRPRPRSGSTGRCGPSRSARSSRTRRSPTC